MRSTSHIVSAWNEWSVKLELNLRSSHPWKSDIWTWFEIAAAATHKFITPRSWPVMLHRFLVAKNYHTILCLRIEQWDLNVKRSVRTTCAPKLPIYRRGPRAPITHRIPSLCRDMAYTRAPKSPTKGAMQFYDWGLIGIQLPCIHGSTTMARQFRRRPNPLHRLFRHQRMCRKLQMSYWRGM
jgi:hypothetical protein